MGLGGDKNCPSSAQSITKSELNPTTFHSVHPSMGRAVILDLDTS
jgi:hypothetical protein